VNARYFAIIFEAELARSRMNRRPLGCVMADLDFLRDINNTYGHLAGDAVLINIGKIIRDTVRVHDIAARFGGEEFSILLPDTDAVGAHLLAERIREIIAATPFEIPGSQSPIHVTMSLGVACYPYDAPTSTELLAAADVAVYQAKHAGRNRVVSVSSIPDDIRQAVLSVKHLPARAGSPPAQARSAPAPAGAELAADTAA
jgi:two-component system cell cycle response regulator